MLPEITREQIANILLRLNHNVHELRYNNHYDDLRIYIPKYFQQILIRYNQTVFASFTGQYEKLYGVKIVDGYEDAIIVCNIMDYELKPEKMKRIELNFLKK